MHPAKKGFSLSIMLSVSHSVSLSQRALWLILGEVELTTLVFWGLAERVLQGQEQSGSCHSSSTEPQVKFRPQKNFFPLAAARVHTSLCLWGTVNATLHFLYETLQQSAALQRKHTRF